MGRIKRWIAMRLRFLADRIDWAGAPKRTQWSFTYEPGKGAMFHNDGLGCPLWYYGNEDYERAHNEGGHAR